MIIFYLFFMALEHCSLVPLIINYRMGKDLMKIFTFKQPRILCLWENTYFSLLTDAAQTTAKQLLRAHRYTPILHTLHVHVKTYPVFSQLFSFHFIITKKQLMNSPEDATLLFVAVWNIQVTKTNVHKIKIGQNNEWQLQKSFSLCQST